MQLRGLLYLLLAACGTSSSAQDAATDAPVEGGTSLPHARANFCATVVGSYAAAVVAGNFLYVLGGASASATDTVYAAQVRF